MATLTAWQYRTPLGATAGAVRLRRLAEAEALEVFDAIVVTWLHGVHRPRVAHVRRRQAPLGKVSVLAPLVQMLTLDEISHGPRTTVPVVAELVAGTGITPGFLVEVIDQLGPGSSLLMVLSGDADPEMVRPVVEQGLERGGVRLLHADVPDDAAEALARALGRS